MYGCSANKIGVFTSPFSISIIPCLDRCMIDMVASQDFEKNFVCYKEVANKITAIKKPNHLVTWNWDTGKVICNVELKGMDFERETKHSEWEGTFLLQRKRQFKSMEVKQGDGGSAFISKDVSIVNEEELVDDNNYIYTLVEILSTSKVVEHLWFEFEQRQGLNLFVSQPYLLAMDEKSTRMYKLDGPKHKKDLRLLKTFFDT